MIKSSVNAIYLIPQALKDSGYFLRLDESWNPAQVVSEAISLNLLHPSHACEYISKYDLATSQLLASSLHSKKLALMYLNCNTCRKESCKFIKANPFALDNVIKLHFDYVDRTGDWGYLLYLLSIKDQHKIAFHHLLNQSITKKLLGFEKYIRQQTQYLLGLQLKDKTICTNTVTSQIISYLRYLSNIQSFSTVIGEHSNVAQAITDFTVMHYLHILEEDSIEIMVSLITLFNNYSAPFEELIHSTLHRFSKEKNEKQFIIDILKACYRTRVPFSKSIPQAYFDNSMPHLYLFELDSRLICKLLSLLIRMEMITPQRIDAFTRVIKAKLDILDYSIENICTVKLFLQSMVIVNCKDMLLYKKFYKYSNTYLEAQYPNVSENELIKHSNEDALIMHSIKQIAQSMLNA